MDETFMVSVTTKAMIYSITIIVSLTAVYSMYEAVLALRAKRRAAFEVAHAIITNMKLKQAIKEIDTQQDIQDLTKEIERALKSLTEQDQKFVRQGLHQESKAAVKRFLKDVVTPELV